MARPATLFGVIAKTADSRCAIECVFLNESCVNAIPNSGSWLDAEMIEPQSGLRFSTFQPIGTMWDNSTEGEPNASDEELIYSARKYLCGPV
jgi:hypothetical protein